MKRPVSSGSLRNRLLLPMAALALLLALAVVRLEGGIGSKTLLAEELGGILAIFVAGWWLLRRHVLGPLERIEEAIRNSKTDETPALPELADDEIGRMAKTLAVSFDALKEREHRIRTSEHRFQEMAANIEEMFWMVDVATGRLLYVSPTCEEFSGHSASRLFEAPRLWFDAVQDDDDRAALVAAVEKGEPFERDVRMTRADGTIRVLSVHCRALDEEVDTGRRFVGVARDVTDRRENERLLDTANREARTAFRELELQRFTIDQHAIVSITGADGRITSVNDKLCSISGYTREELIGQDHRILNSGFHPGEFFAGLYATIHRGDVWHGEIRNRAKDGSFYWVSATIVPVKGDDGKPVQFISIRNDITALKETQIALLEAKEQSENSTARLQDTIDAVVQMSEEANRASRAKTEFLAVMSHEIRTPLNGVLGMTELTLGTDLDAEQTEYLTMVKSSADSLLAIINDILDFSKIETGRFELDSAEFSLRDLVRNVVALHRPRAESAGLNLSSRINLRDGGDRFIGDPVRLQQILNNLLANATKFTHAGEVSVEVSGGEALASDPSRCTVHVAVRDTGIGISPESVGRIFEPFTQGDASSTRKYGGTGLGLAICRRLCELMEGRISVESTPGSGSVFSLHVQLGLPARATAVARAAASDEPALEEVMNYEGAVRNTGGDPRTMRDICRIFLDDSPGQIDRLRGAVLGGDWQQATSVVQNLEASLGLLASNRALETALAVKRACADRDREAAQVACLPFETELTRFNRALSRLLPGHPR